MHPTLSVCLLTRDDENHLARAIDSVRDLADEVVVIDTGSTDQTAEVARNRGALVETIAWDDDFAQGRNAALRKATGEWVFWLNPDEALVFEGRERLRPLLENGEIFGYEVLIRHLLRGDRPDLWTETTDVRLFRRHPEVAYVGRAHPRFAPQLGEAVRREGLSIASSPLILSRLAYLSHTSPTKLRWAARLLRRELADRPGQFAYQVELADTLLRMDDPSGHDLMAEAARGLDLSSPNGPGDAGQVLLEYVLAVDPKRNQTGLDPEQSAELALRWYPASPPLLWALAKYRADRQDYARAILLLGMLLEIGRTGTFDRSRGFEPGIIGEQAMLNLGHCLARQGRIDEAEACFSQLVGSPEHHVAAVQALEVIRHERWQRTGVVEPRR